MRTVSTPPNNEAADLPEILTRGQAAAVIGYSVSMLKKETAAKKIPIFYKTPAGWTLYLRTAAVARRMQREREAASRR